MNDKTLIVLAGPTASGKTRTAIALARHFQTVIISADSRQFYREMQIGTAAPTSEELAMAEHFMVHNKSIFDNYTVADYEKDVSELLENLFRKHDKIILTGGSGLFINAVCNGIDVMPNIENTVRQRVERLLKENGLTALQEEVKRLDPDFYAIADTKNPRRLQRALEVCYQTGLPFSSFRLNNNKKRDFEIIKIAIQTDRRKLIERIDKRVDDMMKQGLLDEVKAVFPYRHLNTLNTVGYKELFRYLDNEISLKEAVELVKISTRQYAKRQMTWFRKDTDYKWFTLDQFDDMVAYCERRPSLVSE